MKHFTLLLLMCSMIAQVDAQYLNPAHFENLSYLPINSASQEWNKKYADKNIKSQHSYFEKFRNGESKGSPEISYVSFYDKKGQFIASESYRKGKLEYKTYFEYNEEGYQTKYKSLRKDKPYMMTMYEYNDRNQVVKRSNYWKDTVKPIRLMTYVYDDTGNLNEMISFHKGKVDDRWVYEYYPNNSKKSVAKYNGKGKLKNITSYECKPEGQLLAMADKDTGRICIRHEFDEAGEEIRIVEERAPRGREEKIIYKYNSVPNLLERAGYNSKGERISYFKRNFNSDKRLQEHINYKKGGSKIHSRYVYGYDDDGFHKRKFCRYQTRCYNDGNGLTTKPLSVPKQNEI